MTVPTLEELRTFLHLGARGEKDGVPTGELRSRFRRARVNPVQGSCAVPRRGTVGQFLNAGLAGHARREQGPVSALASSSTLQDGARDGSAPAGGSAEARARLDERIAGVIDEVVDGARAVDDPAFRQACRIGAAASRRGSSKEAALASAMRLRSRKRCQSGA